VNAKRAFDLTFAAAGSIVLVPLTAVIASLIALERSGPVFYTQERVGKDGRTFRMWKFRTMYPGADKHGLLTVDGVSRVTPTGKWLRRWKLDELPQLWNVLRGEMTLVGPRPEVPLYVGQYSPEQRRVLKLTPGVTDPASIAYRDESALLAKAADPDRYYVGTLMPEKIRLNLEYAARANVLTDLGMVLRTIGVMFK
jgi:lipopolysaccharide/colanic/teichoic acid biosynthesis glycosyltransferase